MKRLYNAYKAEELDILTRPPVDSQQANNKLVNAFRTNIVNQAVGYIFGEPIQYGVDVDDEGLQESFNEWIKRYRLLNRVQDLDATTGKFMTVCGYGLRLNYIDKILNERTMNIYPWEGIVINDGSLDEPQYGMIYYQIDVREGDSSNKRYMIEWYDQTNVSYFLETSGGRFEPYEGNNGKEDHPHLFKYMPLVKFKNNDEEQGDFEIVEPLIDAYDRLVSDAQNVIEDFRSAYLVFEGGDAPTKDEVDAMKRARAIAGPGKVSYLTKEIADEFLENQKDTLKANIYRFTQSVDMDDDAFHSAESGEARKWRLMALENKAIVKERKFDAALREQFRILTSYQRSPNIDYLDFTWEFRRNLPIDLQYLGEVAMKFKGILSHKTILSLLPFVDDPQAEYDEYIEEMGGTIDLDDYDDGDEGDDLTTEEGGDE